jgi:polyisoprenoid-binding protein YceI
VKKSTRIVVALVALIALAVGGFLVWFFFIKADAPPALTSDDLDEALGGTSTTAISGTGTTLPPPADPSDPSGTWVVTTDSTLGYRVKEVLGGLDTEGAGRTNQITGSLTIVGTQATAAEFTVDMATFRSDDSRRDNQFRGRIMSVDQFPTATFVLTAPIEFGAVPEEGTSLTATATGDLTLRGVTRSVTFELEAKLQNGRIGVLGNIPVVFADYAIPNPSNGFAETADNGLLEFVLVFDRG